MPEESHFEAVDGTKLFRRTWRPASEARAEVLLAHGYGEHCGRYPYLVEHLLDSGFAIHALDHRGHGKSEGQRGHVADFSEFVDDLHGLRREAVGGELPLFLIGHSMGGLIAAQYLLAYGAGLAGAVLSSPALGLRLVPPLPLRLAATLLSFVAPRIRFAGDIDASKLSHEASVGPEYLADPLVHQDATPRFFAEFRDAIDDSQERASTIATPLLVLQAGDDHMVDPDAAEAFAAAAPQGECRRYPELFHELFLERQPERERVLADLEAWLEARLAAA